LRKNAVTAIDALAEAHKKRVDRAFKKSLGDPAAFGKRLAKLRARFDGELALVRLSSRNWPQNPPPRHRGAEAQSRILPATTSSRRTATRTRRAAAAPGIRVLARPACPTRAR
jgi:hypothetical protein